MKTEKLLMLCIALFFLQLVACERSKMDQVAPDKTNSGVRTGGNEDATNGRIVADKTIGIKQKEPINFTLTDPKSDFVLWRVIPAQTVINKGVKSVIQFQKAGNYRVFAIDSMSLDTAFIDVWVSDEVDTRPSGEQAFKYNETLRITPSFSPDSANVLTFSLATDGIYKCSNNKLITSIKAISYPLGDLLKTEVSINCARVSADLMCETGENKPKGTLNLVNPADKKISGYLEILFKNQTYYGSFTKIGNKYEFDWPYNSGVVFTTKSL